MKMSVIAFLLMTGLAAGNVWRFDDTTRTTPSADGAYIELETGPSKNYIPLQEMGLDLTRGQSLIFQVRALREVHLALHKDAGDTRQHVYEITLGGWANTLSVIRKAVASGRIVVDHRHHPLSSTEFRFFWVSWAKGRLAVGNGETVGVDAFMTYRDPFAHPVNYISVSTAWGVTGMWKFVAPSSVIGLWTNPLQDLQFHSLNYRGYDVETTSHFTFWVKASNDAHVVLTSDTLSYSNMYWVSLGGLGNTRSFIRKGRMGPDLAHAVHSPLSSEHYLPFWIRWESGVVTVGEGTRVGRRQFMSWTDSNPFDVTDMYVSTSRGSSGHWLIELIGDHDTRQLPTSGDDIPLNA